MLASLRRVVAILILFAPGSLAVADQCGCTAPSACTVAPPVALFSRKSDCNPCAHDSCCTAEPSCCQECCCCDPIWYASFNLRGTVDNVKTRGFDTPPPTDGDGEEPNDPLGIGGAVGFSVPFGENRLRMEVEGMYFSSFHIDTPNVLAPFPPAFYSRYFGRWAVLANAWYDIPLNERYDFYFGGGIGGGGATLEVLDGIGQGSASVSDVIWQVGCGGVRHFQNCSIDVGYRYMDFGTYNIGIFDAGGNQTGNFRTDLTSHQLFIGFRFNSLLSMFSR